MICICFKLDLGISGQTIRCCSSLKRNSSDPGVLVLALSATQALPHVILLLPQVGCRVPLGTQVTKLIDSVFLGERANFLQDSATLEIAVLVSNGEKVPSAPVFA